MKQRQFVHNLSKQTHHLTRKRKHYRVKDVGIHKKIILKGTSPKFNVKIFEVQYTAE